MLKIDDDRAVETTRIYAEPGFLCHFVPGDFGLDFQLIHPGSQLRLIGHAAVLAMKLHRSTGRARRCRQRLQGSVVDFIYFIFESKQAPVSFEFDLVHLGHRHASLSHENSRSSANALATQLARLSSCRTSGRISKANGDVRNPFPRDCVGREDHV